MKLKMFFAMPMLLIVSAALAQSPAVVLEVRELPEGSSFVVISSGVDELEYNVSTSDKIKLDFDFFDDSAYRKVFIHPKKEGGELDASIDIIICSKNCKPLALYFPDIPTVIQSGKIQKVCRRPANQLREQFERYFFCRAQYRIFEDGANEDFKDAYFALFGWFEAAYKLNETLRYKGYPVFPRDAEVERKVTSEAQKKEFVRTVGANSAYFQSMISNMSTSERTKIRYAEYLRTLGMEDQARRLLLEIGQSSASEPEILGKEVSSKEKAFIEGV